MAKVSSTFLVDESAEADEIYTVLSEVYKSVAPGEMIGGRWTRSLVASELKNGSVLATKNQSGFLKAFIMFRVHDHCLEISMLATDPAARSQGLMGQLMRKLQGQAKSLKRDIWLEVHERNQSAIGLYKAFRFTQTGVRPNYYADGGSAVLMTWQFDPSGSLAGSGSA